jgi:plasmid stability protein
MKNVTVTLEEDVAHWVRVQAAEQHQSVARFLGELLRQKMREEQGYEDAMKRFLSRKPSRISEAGVYSGREELHDRASLRRQ